MYDTITDLNIGLEIAFIPHPLNFRIKISKIRRFNSKYFII